MSIKRELYQVSSIQVFRFSYASFLLIYVNLRIIIFGNLLLIISLFQTYLHRLKSNYSLDHEYVYMWRQLVLESTINLEGQPSLVLHPPFTSLFASIKTTSECLALTCSQVLTSHYIGKLNIYSKKGYMMGFFSLLTGLFLGFMIFF